MTPIPDDSVFGQLHLRLRTTSTPGGTSSSAFARVGIEHGVDQNLVGAPESTSLDGTFLDRDKLELFDDCGCPENQQILEKIFMKKTRMYIS